jgi:3-oxoacyl-[acyl-carrier protein] reductase
MKNALVTGGSGAIGAAICRRLAGDGCHVYVHAHRGMEAARTLAEAIGAGGGSAQVLAFDVTDSTAVAAALAPLVEREPIQILVNNAGIHDDAVFPGMRAEQWRRVIDVSVNGFFNVTQPLMMPMIRSRWGRIVNVSSIAALIGNRVRSIIPPPGRAPVRPPGRWRRKSPAGASPSTRLRPAYRHPVSKSAFDAEIARECR